MANTFPVGRLGGFGNMAIRYDNYVKRPNQEIEYTQDMIDEMIKCKDDVMYFVKNYVKIVTLGFW
jgi:hypothetical protein